MQDSGGQPPSSLCITRQPEEVFISLLSPKQSNHLGPTYPTRESYTYCRIYNKICNVNKR